MFGGMGLPPVVAHLMADIGEFAAKMGEAEAMTAKVTQSGAASWKSAGKEMMATGGIMAVAAGAVALETMHMASGFDTMMERVHTQAGASQAEVDGLKQKVLNLGMATGQGPEKLAEALYHVESVGYRGKTAMDVLTNSAKLASISGANLDDTTYGLTSVMQTFGAKAGDAAKYAALFNATVGAGDMKMEAFNRAVGTGFYSVAQTFGLSAQSASAALAFMTDRGAHADEAATRLRMSIALLAAPSAKATTVLHSMGLTSEAVGAAHKKVNGILERSKVTYSQLATDLHKPDGFYEALKHLKKGLEDTGLSSEAANAQLSHAFGGGKSDATILAMLNNLDTLKSKYQAVGKGMGAYGESYAAAQKTAANQTARFKATAEALGIEIGHVLMPYALKFLGWLRDLAQWLASHTWAVKALALLIGVTLVVGLALATAGAIAFAAATVEIWGPIFLIILGLMALVAAVIYVWTHWSQIWGWVVDRAKAVGGWISKTWDSIKTATREKWQAVLDWIKGIWHKIAAWFSSAWHTVTDPIVKAWQWVKDTTARIFNSVLAWLKHWWPLLVVIFLPWLAAIIALWNHFHVQVFSTVTSWWNNVKGWLSTAWTWITNAAKTAWKAFYDNVVAPVQRAARVVGIWLDVLRYHVRLAFQTAMQWLHNQWDRFYNTVIAPVQRVARSIGGFLNGIGRSVRDQFNGIMDWLRGLWNSLWSIGSWIMSGLWSGIKAWFGTILSGIGSFFSGLLDSAKSLLGINSPSKVFADEVGKWIPAGIAVGIDAHAHLATGSVSSMADKLRIAGEVAMSPSLQMGAVSSAAHFAVTAAAAQHEQPIIHAHLSVEAKVDKQVLFKTTQTEALKHSQRNSAPAFTSK